LGFFITFEGPEGCGKSTQMQLLAGFLQQQGYDVLATREPGGTRIGDRVRSILLDPALTEMLASTEFLLFSSARAQHVGQVIRPHLEFGGIVLCDRFADSSLAYQGYGYDRDLEVLRAISRYATDALVPDLTLLLDLPVEMGLQRKQGGGGDAWNRMEQKLLDYHRRVHAGYLAMAAKEPERWILVDATPRSEKVQSAIRAVVASRLGFSMRPEGGNG
jgi:dTMP kinase